MLGDEPLGFSATAPVGVWNKRLGVDYPGVFKALLKATLAYATLNVPGGLSATIDGLFAFKLEDRPPAPAELAWLLIRRALGHAMAKLAAEALSKRAFQREDVEALVDMLDAGLGEVEVWIDPEFFDRPAEHPVLGAIQPPFARWLAAANLNEAEIHCVERRLGSYFTFSLRREWARHFDQYVLLDAEIRKWDTPFAKADGRERSWLRNAAWLQRQVEEPVFDETFGLKEVYVPLRAWYAEGGRASSRRRETVEEADEKGRRIIVDLEQALDDWLRTADRKDAIRVICGGPGSGKTSSAKMWAARLTAEGHRVLFVPLHRLDFQAGDVQKSLADFLRDWDVFDFDPLDSREGEPRLLILFDGLDELAMQGRAGQEVARSFVEAVQRRAERVNEQEGRCLQVVFGGRDVVVAAAENLLAGRQLLHVLPYDGTSAGDFAEGQKLLKDSRYACNRWWQRFGNAVGESYDGLPEPLQNEDLADITAQPLLNYLLALSFRRGKLDFTRAPILNAIYADLLDAVYDRPWGGPVAHPTTKPLTREEFDLLLDELGFAAWHRRHGTGRTVTEAEVEAACRRANLQEQLERFQEGARAGAISFLAAFYFRQAGKIQGGERTFEFTHQSFGEFLTARRLVRWIEDIHEERVRNRTNRQRGLLVEDALIKWTEATGPTALDQDLLAFIEREMQLRECAVLDKWRQTFAELFADQLNHGLPTHRTGVLTFQEMTRRARNAEEALLAAIHACAAALNDLSAGPRAQERTEVRWPDEFAARDLIARLHQGRGWSAVAPSCLGWLNLQGADLRRADLRAANLRGADLSGADLSGADLWGADLGGADLYRANLWGADLSGADLGGADLGGARLGGADLTHANLTETDLTEANLNGASLHEANLEMANLVGTNLKRADLVGADLRGADLSGADLRGANLGWADLRGANLHETNLHEANLHEASLDGVRNLPPSSWA